MTITISWLDKNETIICQKFEEGWNGNEHAQSYKDLMDTIRKKDHDVHLIVDFTEPNSRMSKMLLHSSQFVGNIAPNLGVIVFASDNTFSTSIKWLIKAYSPQTTPKVNFVANLDEALTLLKEEIKTGKNQQQA